MLFVSWTEVSEWTVGGYLMARSPGNYSHNFDYKELGQIHLSIFTNNFVNLDKYVSPFGQRNFDFWQIGKYILQFWQTCFIVWKNPFSNCDMWWPDRLQIISTTFLVKSQEKCIFQFDTNILQLGEIYLASLTNIFAIFRNTFVNWYI